MIKWVCSVCGYIVEGENPPEFCPVCGADEKDFLMKLKDYPKDVSADTWRCEICGFISNGEKPPTRCPVCKASSDDFEPILDKNTLLDLVDTYKDEFEGDSQGTSWRCSVCGYIYQGETPPDDCPICKADSTRFVKIS